jgi:hypothetical protein
MRFPWHPIDRISVARAHEESMRRG